MYLIINLNNQPLIKRLLHTTCLIVTIVYLSDCTEIQPVDKCNPSSHTNESPACQANFYYDDTLYSSAIQAKGALSNNSDTYKEIIKLIDTRQLYHDAVLAYPTEKWSSKHSLYLLGFEKPRGTESAIKPYNYKVKDKEAPVTFASSEKPSDTDAISSTRDYMHKILNDPKSMVLTHILKVKSTVPNAEGSMYDPCFVYNIYADNLSVENDNSSLCVNHKVTSLAAQVTAQNGVNNEWTYNGWQALDQLGKELREKIEDKTQNNTPPTHLIMLATGWNTKEYESLRDFEKWMDELKYNYEKAGERFNPIYIGIASELEWPGEGGDLKGLYSMVTKGRDADELGFTWINYLLNNVLKPIAKDTGIQVVGIGHSFGSRVIFGSHYARGICSKIIQEQNKPNKSVQCNDDKNLDNLPITLIGMQAAFPTGRFISTRGEDDFYLLPPDWKYPWKWPYDLWEGPLYFNHPYLSTDKGGATVVVTTSDSDAAAGQIPSSWVGLTGFIGGIGGIEEIKNYAYKSAISFIERSDVHVDGKIDKMPDKNLATVYDASNFVSSQLPGTQSGSHSDVYDKEMGNFLGQVIRHTSKMQ